MSVIDNRLRVHCEFLFYADKYALHIAQGHPVNAVAQPLVFIARDPGQVITDEPALRLRREEAQEFIDALWSAGLRPTQGRQSEGVTAAQNCHLQDMRAIAFAKLNVERP